MSAGSTTVPPSADSGGLRDWSSLIKVSHTVFALPFALLSLAVAGQLQGGPEVGVLTVLLVVVAVTFARSSAMAYNRLVDRDVDRENPRTAEREIPAGKLSARAVTAFVVITSVGFVLTSFALSPVCGYASVPTLLFLLGYSHAKRFTSLAHLWLGIALGLACPAGALAARGDYEPIVFDCVWLGLGVAFWVFGFDVIYACQDEAFDRERGLHSVPARLGRSGALRAAGLAHVLAISAFVTFGWSRSFGVAWGVGVLAIVFLLGRQHLLAWRSGDRPMDPATFAGNGAVGFVALGAAALEIWAL